MNQKEHFYTKLKHTGMIIKKPQTHLLVQQHYVWIPGLRRRHPDDLDVLEVLRQPAEVPVVPGMSEPDTSLHVLCLLIYKHYLQHFQGEVNEYFVSGSLHRTRVARVVLPIEQVVIQTLFICLTFKTIFHTAQLKTRPNNHYSTRLADQNSLN